MNDQKFLELCKEYENIPSSIIANNDELSSISVLIEIGKCELKFGVKGFFAGNTSIETMIAKFIRLKHLLRRIEYQLPDNLTSELIDVIKNIEDDIIITPYALLIIILRCSIYRIQLIDKLIEMLNNADLKEYAEILSENRQLVKESIVQCVYKK